MLIYNIFLFIVQANLDSLLSQVIALQHFTRYVHLVDHMQSMHLLGATQPSTCPSTRLLKVRLECLL